MPGDKSISHRSLILAGMAIGETRLGLLRGEDVLSTLRALQQLGVPIADDKDADILTVSGIGICGLQTLKSLSIWATPVPEFDFSWGQWPDNPYQQPLPAMHLCQLGQWKQITDPLEKWVRK